VPERTLRELRALRERTDAEISRLVTDAALRGANSLEIAKALDISRATLWRRYAGELKSAHGSHRSARQGSRPTG
jgi:transcriptional regulator of acetoin/glycerol metabolism